MMMKQKAILSVALLLLAACTADNQCNIDTGGDTGGDGSEAMLSIETTVTSATRSLALLGESFAHEAQLNLILLDAGATSRYGGMKPYVYKKPTEGAGSWIPGEEGGHKLVDAQADVLAHYPAALPNEASLSTDKRTLNVALPATLDFFTPETYNAENAFYLELEAGKGTNEVLLADGEVDYMIGCGANAVYNAVQSTTIAMYHALAMVVVRARKTPENTNPGVIKSIAFANKANAATPMSKGSFDLKTHLFTPGSEPMRYTRTMDKYPDGTCFALMVYPTTIAAKGDVELLLEVDQAHYTLPLNARTWAPGGIVFYNVTLKATTAELNEGMSVLPWPGLDDGDSHEIPLD